MLTGWLLPLTLAVNTAASVSVGVFSQGDLTGWQEKSFRGETIYRLTETEQGKALCASSKGTASGIYRRLSVDLTQTPYLTWSWRVDNVLKNVDETTREGDDYPARIYAIKFGGLFFWRTRALVYVWSSNQPIDSIWKSAYTSRVRVIAVRSGAKETGRWLVEKRDVTADFRRAFGDGLVHIDSVAIMTDTDNSASQASTCYGDIYFEGSKIRPPISPLFNTN